MMGSVVDFETMRRSPLPNTALVAPEGLCQNASADEAAPVFEDTPEDLWKKLLVGIVSTRHWTIKSRDDDEMHLKFVAVTPFMRFRDDVDVRVLPVGKKKSTIAIYSRSRIGYSDLGKNLKRARAIVASLQTK